MGRLLDIGPTIYPMISFEHAILKIRWSLAKEIQHLQKSPVSFDETFEGEDEDTPPSIQTS